MSITRQDILDIYRQLDEGKQAQARRLLQNLIEPETNSAKMQIVSYFIPKKDTSIDANLLRNYVRERLPEYMVPAFFIPIKELPLTPNGKLDQKQLPPPVPSSAGTEKLNQPTNKTEETLLALWKDVLGVKDIGTNSNFFEIGGDSILSIQIIARAKKYGLHITPKQMFQQLTISDLAKVVSFESVIVSEQGKISGDLPLTPIQHWLQDQRLRNPAYWNQGCFFEVPQELDINKLKNALVDLLEHHDMLRAKFDFSSKTWQQTILDEVASPDVRIMNTQNRAGALLDDFIQKSIVTTHSSLDPQAGLNLAACLFEMDNQENLLFIAIHHLVVDAVSWRVIQEDLETLYAGANNLPEKSTSFKRWSKKLTQYADSKSVINDAKYWARISELDAIVLPADYQPDIKTITESTNEILTVSLNQVQTDNLLRDVPAVYNTQIDDILLSALLQAYSDWTGSSNCVIEREGHGRESFDDTIDISRTVGWFTSFYNVLLSSPDIDDNETTIKSVKENLRAVPGKGFSYGLLKYVTNSELESIKNIHKQPRPAILYNYLGHYKQDKNSNIFKLSDRKAEPSHDPHNPIHHALEIDALIFNSCLSVDIVYNTKLHKKETIQSFTNHFLEHLVELITFCLSRDKGGFTPSDFPEAQLDQGDLDSLLDELDGLND